MTQQLYQYAYLQILDFLTTVAFLMNGVHEGNPLVRLAMRAAPTPLSGLLIIKLFAVGLGVCCWTQGKAGLLTKINIVFAVLILWNLLSLILNSA